MQTRPIEVNNEIKNRTKRNFIQNKKLSEMFEDAVKRYQNRLITAAEVIEELIELAKDIRDINKEKDSLNLTDYEMAFYDALANNESAEEVLKKEILRELAQILVKKVKSNANIDWTIKINVRAKLRLTVKKTLKKYGYPPDKEKLAIDNILKQAELFAEEWFSDE